jgi:hypothetical protein
MISREKLVFGNEQDPASWRAGRDAKLLDWLAVPAVRTKQRERTPADPYAAQQGSSLVQCDPKRTSPRWAKCDRHGTRQTGGRASGEAEGHPRKQRPEARHTISEATTEQRDQKETGK